MKKISLGEKTPSVSVFATGDKKISFAEQKDKNIVLYFYPRDNTPGCTLEGQNFRDHYSAFESQNTIILGVSRDTIASHEKFKNSQQFPFDLLSDKDENLCEIFDVIKEKNRYGKMVKGIERSTFLIDKTGRLYYEWRKVKVKGHVEEVLNTVKKLNGN